MARIRTIKPEFFRHEALQDLEIANPGMYPMMVFEALWGHCNSKGRFEWKPRMLKLDILPFLPFDMAKTLGILERSKIIRRYIVDGKEYGEIETFEKHQRLSGKELTEGEKFPPSSSGMLVKQQGSVGEMPESQEGKGREEEGKVDAPPASPPSRPKKEPADENETALQATCRETMKTYASAYWDRYQTEPVVNAKVRSQIKLFCQRLPYDEAPQVAGYYVTNQAAYYVRKGHDLGSMLADAEKLRTEWATNRQITDTQARQHDRSQSNMSAADEAMRILEAAGVA